MVQVLLEEIGTGDYQKEAAGGVFRPFVSIADSTLGILIDDAVMSPITMSSTRIVNKLIKLTSNLRE